jgi:hypothetical protein
VYFSIRGSRAEYQKVAVMIEHKLMLNQILFSKKEDNMELSSPSDVVSIFMVSAYLSGL